jgi:O-antigen ligase
MGLAHRILDRVIFYGLLGAIVITAVPYGSVQPWWVALFECVMFALGALAIVDLFITKDRLPAGASVALPLLILCLYMVFQSLPLFGRDTTVLSSLRVSLSADPYTTQLLALKLFALILAGVLLVRYANTEPRTRTLVFVVLGVGVASAIFGILRQESGGPHWFFPLPKPDQGFAQFVNRNHFGFLMEMTFGLALGFGLRASRGYQKWLLLLPIAAFLWVSLVIANSRGAIFASLCQALFLLVFLDPSEYLANANDSAKRALRIGVRWAARVAVAVILVVVFVAGVSWVGGERVTTNIELASTAYDQPGLDPRMNTRRKQIWSATWQMFKSHPVVGTGLGAYWIAVTKYHDASGQFTPQEAHNDYLEVLASGGLITVALILWFAVRLVNHRRRSIEESGLSAALTLGAWVGIFGVMVHSFVDFGLHITVNALVFTVLLALLVHHPEPDLGSPEHNAQLT